MEEKVVWTNGCFDILHRGHIELFKYAKSLGDEFFVGIDGDEKVKLDKGPQRPYNTLQDRTEMLKSIRHIDEVYTFNTTLELEMLIKEIAPDVLLIGSDWQGKNVIGQQYAKEVKFFERIKGYSTTQILESSLNR